MATPPVNSVNPIQATPDPEYKSYQWSRAISPIEGNKSSEIALKGDASLLTEGVNAADTGIKNYLTNSIEDQAGAKRDAYSNELGSTLDALRGGNLKGADAHAEASTDSVAKMNLLSTDKDTGAIPKDLQGYKGLVEKQEALKANGKQTESQYMANIAALTKQYRTAWPGYREFIDDTTDRVTQRGPANKLIQMRVAELDAYAQAAKEQKGKVESLLQHAQEVDHIPGSNQWEADFKSGKLTEDGVRQKYNQSMGWKFTAEKAKSDWEMTKIGDEKDARLAERAYNATITNSYNNLADTLGSHVGYNLDKIQADIASNDPVIKGHAEQLATQLAASKAQILSAGNKEAMAVDKDGRSMFRSIGAAKFEELQKNNPVVQNIDRTISLLTSKDNGLATISMRMQHEAVTNAQWNLLSENTGMSRALFGMETVKGLGDAANSKILQDTLGKNGALQNLPEWFQRYNVLGATQPNENDPKVPYEDKYITLNHAIKEVQANKGKPDPIAFQRLFNTTVQNITDPKTPAKLKENYINFAFAPQNLGVLEKVADDHVDPQTGQKIPGKVWLYQQMTSEGIAKSVAEMAKSKPQLYAQYQDFVSQEGQHIASQEVPKLNSLFDNPRLKMSYDNTTHQFSVQEDKTYKTDLHAPNAKGESILSRMVSGGLAKVQAGSAQQHVDKINQVLRSVGIMSQYSPDKPDANAYALRLLGAISPPGSVGEKMVKAIMATAPKEPTK